MFLYLIDKLGPMFGMICVGLAPVLIGFSLVVALLVFVGKKTWVVVALSVGWYILLVCFMGGFARNILFIYISLLYATTVSSGICFFSNTFKHRILMYGFCWLSFFMHGLPLCIGAKDTTIYDLAMCGEKNTKQIVEWGIKKMLTTGDVSLARKIKLDTTEPIYRGLVEICLSNYHEAVAFFKEASQKNNTDFFLNGIIKYYDGEYAEATSIFFENAESEMASLVNVIITTDNVVIRNSAKKEILTSLLNRYVNPGAVANIEETIRYLLFLSLVWGQIITIPIMIFRK